MSEIKTGADLCAEILADAGITTIFCITGAGNLAIVDAIHRLNKTRIVYSHHEQAAVMEAQGYSRITGEPAVALVTTGGGAANTITGLLSAYLDSVPVLLLSGNESSFHCENMADFRAYGVQGFDSVQVAKAVTKNAVRISELSEVARLISGGLRGVTEGRNGPILIDFPMDIQRQRISQSSNRSESIASFREEVLGDQSFVNECATAIFNSKQPIFYFGNGIRKGRSVAFASSIVERYGIPFFLSWSAIDLFEDSHPQNIGRVGLYGDRAGNIILQQADVVVCIGTRLAIPQIGYDKNDFGRKATKWVVDIDAQELSKFDGDNWKTCVFDAEDFLEKLELELSQRVAERDFEISNWIDRIQQIWHQLPRREQVGPGVGGEGFVHSAAVIEHLNQVLPSNSTIVTDVGAGLLTGHYMTQIKNGQRFFTSQGLGEMGFGLPGAIGAYFADESRPLICLNTDGGIMFNLQELQLIAHHNIPIKLFVFNNDGYGMIRISQDNLFQSRHVGSSTDSGISFPNFSDLAKTFKLAHVVVSSEDEFTSHIDNALSAPGGFLIEIKMDPSQKYLPRLSTSKLPDGTLVSPPLEDLDPPIDLDLLEELLGYKALSESYLARGVKYEI